MKMGTRKMGIKEKNPFFFVPFGFPQYIRSIKQFASLTELIFLWEINFIVHTHTHTHTHTAWRYRGTKGVGDVSVLFLIYLIFSFLFGGDQFFDAKQSERAAESYGSENHQLCTSEKVEKPL